MAGLRTVEVGLGSALGLGAGRVARVVLSLFGGAAPRGPLLVLGDEVARALYHAGIEVLLVAGARPGRAARGLPLVETQSPAALPLEDATLGGAVIARLDDATGLGEVLAECARVVVDRAPVVVASPVGSLLRKPPAPEALCGALLHARLVDLEQCEAGSTRITIGRVRRAAR